VSPLSAATLLLLVSLVLASSPGLGRQATLTQRADAGGSTRTQSVEQTQSRVLQTQRRETRLETVPWRAGACVRPAASGSGPIGPKTPDRVVSHHVRVERTDLPPPAAC
jgi:hypothetical protein